MKMVLVMRLRMVVVKIKIVVVIRFRMEVMMVKIMMMVIMVTREEERRRQNAAAEERGEKLERENNLLKLKVLLFISRCFGLYYSWSCQVEILLDMLAQKTAETSLQVKEKSCRTKKLGRGYNRYHFCWKITSFVLNFVWSQKNVSIFITFAFSRIPRLRGCGAVLSLESP